MSASHRLTLISLVALTLAACGGNSSSTPGPGPTPVNPPASQAESAETTCQTGTSPVIDAPNGLKCGTDGLETVSFKVVDFDTGVPTDMQCQVNIAANGDVTVTVPSEGGGATLAGNAPNRHTSYILDPSGHQQFRVWTGGTTFDRANGPFFEIDSPAGSDKVNLYVVPYRMTDGSEYRIKCAGTLPSN